MYWKIKQMLEEEENLFLIINEMLEELRLEDYQTAQIGDLQEFLDLSHEVRARCYIRRGAL